MYPGYDHNSDNRVSDSDFQFKQNDHQRGSPFYQNQNRNAYNAKASNFEVTNDAFQIPHHIRMLFGTYVFSTVDAKSTLETETKPLLEAKPTMNPQGQSNNMASYNSFPSRTTIDSRGHPHASPKENNDFQHFPSFNTLLNQSNEFGLMKNKSGELNNSSLSNRVSLNNLSRDSCLKGDLNSSNSRRNMSSRALLKAKRNYQVNINEDIKLIERIDTVLNQITINHNKTYTEKVIDIRKSNFQNVSAFLSNSTRKYYLTHFDCYLKSNPNQSPPKIVSLSGITKATVNTQLTSLSTIDPSHFLRSDRRAYFLHIEGCHPISSTVLFRLERICYALEHNMSKAQLLYINLAGKAPCFFEPSSYMLPYSELRITVSIHLSHSNEDAYTYEFLADFSQVKVNADDKAKFAEAYYPSDGNGVVLGTQVVYDANPDLNGNKLSLDTSFQSTTSTSTAKSEFGRNVFLNIKQISINLPLKRMEPQNQESLSMSALIPEALLNSQEIPASSLQNKTHSKLHLNPNAPLFSAQTDQVQQPFGMPSQYANTSNVNSFSQNSGNYQSNYQNFNTSNVTSSSNNSNNSNSNSNVNNPNLSSYFNTPLFSQNYQADKHPSQFSPVQFQGYTFQENAVPSMHQQQQNNEGMLPPGLSSPMMQSESSYSSSSSPYGQRPQHQTFAPPAKNRGLYVETRPQGYINDVIAEALEEHQASAGNTPCEIPHENMPFEKTKSKGNKNLYLTVLTGRKNDNSLTNSPCPSASKIHNRYFSAVSTPVSEHDPNPLTPLIDTNNEYYGSEDYNMPAGDEQAEEFRLEDHLGNLVEFAKTYNGSRLLQKFFPRANQEEVQLVIEEIEDSIDELMLDPYANYMFQTLAQSCSAEQRYRLLEEIAPSMVKVACDRKGTHSLQAIISLVSRDAEEKLIRDALNGHIVELAYDSQGTHLIQKLIVAISIQNINFLYQPLVDKFNEVINNSFGLCVFKQLMTKVEKYPEHKGRIIELLCNNLENLIQNPYGNYAIQHAMDVWPNDCAPLLERTVDKIIQYSNQKFSSNVIEKCIIIATPEFRRKYLNEIVKSDRLAELMKNKYGNYVLLKMVSTADLEGKQILMQNIIKNLNSVNIAKYRSRWAQLIDENPMKIPGLNTSQPLRPSQFKNSGSYESGPNSASRDSAEPRSPGPAEWRDNGLKKKPARDEKSQFFYESGKTGGNQRNHGYGDEFEAQNSPALTGSMRRMNEIQSAGSGHKKSKNTNQKFYSEKGQHHMNKGGHNNFY